MQPGSESGPTSAAGCRPLPGDHAPRTGQEVRISSWKTDEAPLHGRTPMERSAPLHRGPAIPVSLPAIPTYPPFKPGDSGEIARSWTGWSSIRVVLVVLTGKPASV